MKLAIDCGNTLIKAGIFDESDNLTQIQKYYPENITDILDFIRKNTFKASVISSVIELPKSIFTAVKESSNYYLYLEKETPLPFTNQYKTPSSLGNDRLAATAGAMSFAKAPLLAINAGTCITYNVLDDQNNFRGGAISPGLQMRFDAMHHFTHALPSIQPDFNEFPPVTGMTTSESMKSAVIHGIIFEIDGYINACSASYPGLSTVMGGGNSGYLTTNLKSDVYSEEHLTLYGLKKILDYNAG